MIPLCEPAIGGNEWVYVKECLDTGWVSSVGAYVDRFERTVAEAVGARFAVATVNGTAALHTALLLAGVGPGDEVLVSTLTFIAPANAIRYAGAWPVFVDAEPRYWQMDPEKLIEFLERGCEWRKGELRNRATGRRVRAILPVHILGHPVDMEPILQAAQRFELTVIEDATESLGACYRGVPVGRLGQSACFSFNGNKLITTGGGGMLVTDDEPLARRAKYLTTQAKDDSVEYFHRTIGYNYRLTNLQAALGVAQMERLAEAVAAKRSIAQAYAEQLESVEGLELPEEAPWAQSVFWLYTIRVKAQSFGCDARGLLAELGRRGVQTRPVWQPLHLSPAHVGAWATDCGAAELLYREALSLPCSVGLAPADQQTVIDQVRAVAGEFAGSRNNVAVGGQTTAGREGA